MANTKLLELLQELRALINETIDELQGPPSPKSRSIQHEETRKHPSQVTFNLNALAFMKKYARGLNGPQKFTLLVAWLSQGDSKTEILVQDATKQWNKMRTVLGEFNGVSANRAKAEGWVDSPKRGVYILTDSWQECLRKK